MMKKQLLKHKGQAALSTICWGVYMVINGLTMIFNPGGALQAMGFAPSSEIWIRMVGILALVMGFYYVQLGRHNFTPFYAWKLIGHIVGILIMITFLLQGLVSNAILMICLTDALAATWTGWGIRHDRKNENVLNFNTTPS